MERRYNSDGRMEMRERGGRRVVTGGQSLTVLHKDKYLSLSEGAGR